MYIIITYIVIQFRKTLINVFLQYCQNTMPRTMNTQLLLWPIQIVFVNLTFHAKLVIIIYTYKKYDILK